jgi:hypothetical protein
MHLLVGTTAGAFSLEESEPLIPDTRINHIAHAGDDWWVVDEKGGLHRNGEQVTQVDDDAALKCVLPVEHTVLVGASRARLLRLEGKDLVEDSGFAMAPGRDEWYTPWGGPPDVRSMAVDSEGTVFINVHVGGILRYDDEGPIPTLDQDADVHQVITDPSRAGTVLAACARGLAQSTDGQVFGYRDDGLHSPYCRAVALTGDTILLSASTGPFSKQARLYRGNLTSGPFEACTKGLPEWFDENLDTHRLAVVDGVAYAGHGDTVWRSDDEGVSWSEARSGLPEVTCLA